MGLVAGASALVLLAGSSAYAQLLSADQKCIDGYNNKLRLVSQQAGKDYRKCVKDAGKGTVADPEVCVATDAPGKIAGKVAKVTDLYTLGKCTGAEVIQQGAPAGSTAHIDGVQNLTRDLFGDPITTNIVSPGKAEAKCTDKAIQRATQAFTESVKTFRKCKKDGMKAGAIVDEATLEAACMTPTIPDPSGKIAGKVAKMITDVTANCTSSQSTLFPGLDAGCHASGAALAQCIDTRIHCRVCETLNEADGMNRDCDLFDDGLGNGSCGLVLHKCVLDVVPASDSQIQIHIAALPVPLVFGLGGALDIGGAGSAAACEIQSLNPVNIPAIGFVCISPASGCANGVRHCGPGAGPALGVDVQSDGNDGVCTSDADCAFQAAAACAPDAVLSASCTGYCSGDGTTVCANDADCLPANGACNGPDGVRPANGDICQIACIDTAAHGPSDPGDLQCNLGSDLVVESGSPCNGTDIIIDVGETCIPVSTQRATSLISDANFSPGSFVPNPPNVNDLSGAPVACATMDGSTVTGLIGVGAVNFFGSALGDLAVGIKATCL
jgi:hypothetical protein